MWLLEQQGKPQVTMPSNDVVSKFFDWLGEHLGHKSMDDWYNVAKYNIYDNGGSGLLDYYYNSSPSKALKSVYPQHNWVAERFRNKPFHLYMKYKKQSIANK